MGGQERAAENVRNEDDVKMEHCYFVLSLLLALVTLKLLLPFCSFHLLFWNIIWRREKRVRTTKGQR